MADQLEQSLRNRTLVSKLTSTARRALNDLTVEYANALINQAYRLASKHDTDAEISYKDILDAHSCIMSGRNVEKQIEKPSKRRRSLTFLLLSARVYTALGLALYFLSVIRSYNDPFIEKIGLIISFFGVATLLLGFILRYLGPNYSDIGGGYAKEEEEYNSSRIVDLWSKIEALGRELIENNSSGGSDEESITTIINYLNSVLNEPSDKEKLKEVLKVRNSIIQESGDSFSRAKLQEIIAIETVIIERLKQMRKNEDLLTSNS